MINVQSMMAAFNQSDTVDSAVPHHGRMNFGRGSSAANKMSESSE